MQRRRHYLLIACALALFATPAALLAENESSAEDAPSRPAAPTVYSYSPPPNAPSLWRPEDSAVQSRRYTVVVGEFPTGVVADGVRTALRNMEWEPLMTQATPSGVRLLLGSFDSGGDATAVAMELRAERLAEATIGLLPLSMQSGATGVDGPRLGAFEPTPGIGPGSSFRWETALARLRADEGTALTVTSDEYRTSLSELTQGSEAENRGRAAAIVAHELFERREEPEATLYLAVKVASGEWEASTARRLRCAEIAADLYYGHRRDWRAAWTATESLLADPDRSPADRARDHLRRAALFVDLATGPEEIRPSWNRVRAELRQAFGLAAEDDARTRAKIELIYLQTFAWEGRWNRVPELAEAFVRRHPGAHHEAALARVHHARALEATEEFRGALLLLDEVLAADLPPRGRLLMGYRALDVKDLARAERRRFNRLLAEVEPPVAPAEDSVE